VYVGCRYIFAHLLREKGVGGGVELVMRLARPFGHRGVPEGQDRGQTRHRLGDVRVYGRAEYCLDLFQLFYVFKEVHASINMPKTRSFFKSATLQFREVLVYPLELSEARTVVVHGPCVDESQGRQKGGDARARAEEGGQASANGKQRRENARQARHL